MCIETANQVKQLEKERNRVALSRKTLVFSLHRCCVLLTTLTLVSCTLIPRRGRPLQRLYPSLILTITIWWASYPQSADSTTSLISCCETTASQGLLPWPTSRVCKRLTPPLTLCPSFLISALQPPRSPTSGSTATASLGRCPTSQNASP